MKAQDLLHDVRERAVPYVVKKSRRTSRRAIFGRDRKTLAETVKHSRHQVQDAERVREAGMLRALVGVERKAQLLDASQALELTRIYEAHHEVAFVRVCAKTNDVVNRIAVDAFGHARSPTFIAGCSGRATFYHSSRAATQKRKQN
jgi:TPP-dependent indolepyruvate ferredoxin oxidoreductase alpha subunit